MSYQSSPPLGVIISTGLVAAMGITVNAQHAADPFCQIEVPARNTMNQSVPLAGPVSAASAFEGVCDDPGSIRILVVYSEQARQLLGGTTEIEALIDAAVFDLNTAFADSGVPAQAVLADAREAGGTFTTNSSSLLRQVTERDGTLDDLHAWRDETDADLVCFVSQTLDTCGRAWVSVGAGNTPNPDLGFSVVSAACLQGSNWVFAHEIGHNLGLYHEWGADICNSGGSPYGKGYAARDDSFRTLMATSGAAPRLLRFSDPDVMVGGLAAGAPATGTDPADASLALQASVGVVASYRLADADMNGLCDKDEILSDPGLDCDSNGVLDSLQADWDRSGVADACEILADPSLDLDGDGVPDHVETQRQYVDAFAGSKGDGTNWASARSSLSEAIALAEASGDVREIWIASGTYRPAPGSTHRAVRFEIPTDVSLYGGFVGTEADISERDIALNPTVLEGDNLLDDTVGQTNRTGDNAVHLLWAWDAGTVVLDGLTLTGAHPDFPVNCGWDYLGGGVFAYETDLIVRNCTFIENSGTWAPGFSSGNCPSVIIEDSDFIRNVAIGDLHRSNGSLGTAGAARLFLRNNDTDAALVQRCRFLGNTTNNGVSAIWTVNGRPVITDSLFSGNATLGPYGFGSAVTLGFPQYATFVNNTVVGNRSSTTSFPVGLQLNGGDGLIANSIFWDNETSTTSFTRNADYVQLYVGQQGAQVDIANSIIMNYRGTPVGIAAASASNMLAADPMFIDQNGPDTLRGTTDDNPRLLTGSPAIDFSDDGLRPASDTLDLDGLSRFIDDPATPGFMTGAVSDLGAYEFQAGPQPCGLADTAPPLGVLNIDDVLRFLTGFATSDPGADVAAPQGVFNVDDVLAFLTAFASGCP